MTSDAKVLVAVLGVAALAVAYMVRQRLAAVDVPGAAHDAGRAIGGAVGGAGTGLVVGIGEAIGIPPTNLSRCEADLAAGRMWEASFSCPAGRFIREYWRRW